jgi:taurine dioxygenase
MPQRRKILVVPTGKALGAEIRGVDLSGKLAAKTIAEIRNALRKHLVIFFRDQELSPEQQAAFARRFGALQRHDYVRGLPEEPEIIEIRKEPHHLQNFGGVWHSDNSYLPNPPLGSILYAREVPDEGGDTIWANQYAAYESLPATVRAEIGPLLAVHSPAAAFGTMRRVDAVPSLSDEAAQETVCEVAHPLVRTHPETKRRALFHSGACTIRLKDWTIAESKPLLDFLLAHATRDEITYRHRWKRHDVIFWDNRCTMHVAMDDYGGRRRIVHRVSIEGDVPFLSARD